MGVNELTLMGVMHSVQDVTTGCVHQQSIVHFNFLPAQSLSKWPASQA